MQIEGTLIIVTPGFAASEDDSTCLPMQQSLVRTFQEVFPQIKIVILSFQYPYHSKMYRWREAIVHCFNGRNKGGMAKLLLRRKIFRCLEELKQTENVLGIFSFWLGECAFVAKKFCDENNLKHRCWLLGQDAKRSNHYPQRISFRSDELVALSDFIQEEFERNFSVRPRFVIPAALNPSHLPACVSERTIDVVGVGSLIPLKQYDVFVDVVAEIKKSIPNIKAVLIGGGSEKKKLEDLISVRDVTENICLLGELPHNSVLEMMQKSKIFLHTSAYEGFGVVCLEALHSGTKVISFVKPMKEEIISWKTVDNNEDMAQEALKLLQDDSIEFKSRIIFDMRETVRNILQLYANS